MSKEECQDSLCRRKGERQVKKQQNARECKHGIPFSDERCPSSDIDFSEFSP